MAALFTNAFPDTEYGKVDSSHRQKPITHGREG